jgi:hypothetical protein
VCKPLTRECWAAGVSPPQVLDRSGALRSLARFVRPSRSRRPSRDNPRLAPRLAAPPRSSPPSRFRWNRAPRPFRARPRRGGTPREARPSKDPFVPGLNLTIRGRPGRGVGRTCTPLNPLVQKVLRRFGRRPKDMPGRPAAQAFAPRLRLTFGDSLGYLLRPVGQPSRRMRLRPVVGRAEALDAACGLQVNRLAKLAFVRRVIHGVRPAAVLVRTWTSPRCG